MTYIRYETDDFDQWRNIAKHSAYPILSDYRLRCFKKPLQLCEEEDLGTYNYDRLYGESEGMNREC